ncbi:alpha/beta hydrolase family protein [Nafulsella turpanensis]|uniref:alpha/beta hydrolase family protein n=1 Tax=Nafulsella turpanensis TaxID=1265690 RepID=UPI00035F95B8|nr:hypothetical protein [Nafulsella turpanensis]
MLAFREEISIPAGDIRLEAELVIPEDAKGIVIFSDGRPDSRQVPLNRFIATNLQGEKFATLLFDLPATEEVSLKSIPADIDKQSERLVKASQWVTQQNETHRLPIGYFGAGTGTAASIKAAAHLGDKIKALVIQGGRPDLSAEDAPSLKAATLLVVGGDDYYVLQQSEKVYQQIKATKGLEIIPGAGPLFEEESAPEQLSTLALQWFNEQLK